jgi:predicted ferric reductase
MSYSKAIPTDEWYVAKRGDIVWHRHIFALIPALVIPTLYGLACIVLCVGSYLSGAMEQSSFLITLQFLMTITIVWIGFHVEDWKDEQYIVSKDAIIYQWRHPFSYESGKRLPKQYVAFAVAELGLKKEGKQVWSFAGFLRWLVGCGQVSIFSPAARGAALTMTDVFLPAQKKQIIERQFKK